MKFVVAVCMCFAVVQAQEITPKINTRDLPADILRDFPGACFASTACQVFQAGQQWPLSPFCGRALCVQGPTGLIERVQDCGLRPKESPGCRITNEADLQKEFPNCCPKYVCEPGKELIYPTEAELKAAADAAQAAAAQGPQGPQGPPGGGVAPQRPATPQGPPTPQGPAA